MDICEHTEEEDFIECTWCNAYSSCPLKRVRRMPRPEFKTPAEMLEFYKRLWDTYTYEAKKA